MEIQLWREILSPYELAVRELVDKFNHLIKEHRERGLYSPIEQVTGRVKSVTSILEKMKRKEIPFEEMEEQVEDIAGIRVICQFVEDIQKVAEIIANRTDMEIKCEKDYIKHTKESGYRSYHLVIYYQIETLHGPKKIQAEIQIRTMAMNFWATIEHSLQYKYKTNIPPHVKERLSKAADAIIALDHEMSSVRSEIMNAQNSSLLQKNLVMDILGNIENLYQKSNKREVEKIQDEFYRIYASNDLQQLRRFHQQLDIIAEGYRAQAVTNDLEA
jgi:putative GTP pyrophosphokinase